MKLFRLFLFLILLGTFMPYIGQAEPLPVTVRTGFEYSQDYLKKYIYNPGSGLGQSPSLTNGQPHLVIYYHQYYPTPKYVGTTQSSTATGGVATYGNDYDNSCYESNPTFIDYISLPEIKEIVVTPKAAYETSQLYAVYASDLNEVRDYNQTLTGWEVKCPYVDGDGNVYAGGVGVSTRYEDCSTHVMTDLHKVGACAYTTGLKQTNKYFCRAELGNFSASPSVIDPTKQQKAVFSYTSSTQGDSSYTLTIEGVRTFSGSGNLPLWDGTNSQGKPVPPGTYNITLKVDSSGEGYSCSDSLTTTVTVTKTEEPQDVTGGPSCPAKPQMPAFSNVRADSGNLSHSQNLFTLTGGSMPLSLSLSYNSLDGAVGAVGEGWHHSYEAGLVTHSGGIVSIRLLGQRDKTYKKSGNNYISLTKDDPDTLVKQADGSYLLTMKDGTLYSFSSTGAVTSINNRNGNGLSFTYTVAGTGSQLTGITDSQERNASLAYDGTGKLVTITDPMGNVYGFEYSGNSLAAVSHPDGGRWSYLYNEKGMMASKTDPNGNIFTYTYDDQARVISATDAEGNSRNYNYLEPDYWGQVTTTYTDKDGSVSKYEFKPGTSQLTSKTDPLANKTSFAYNDYWDSEAQITKQGIDLTESVESSADGTTNYRYYGYDSRHNLLWSVDPLANETSYTYNAFSQPLTITDPRGTITNTYDERGNLTSTTDIGGAVTAYEYDLKGNLTKLTDALGHITTYTYYANNRLETTADVTGTARNTYDANGNVLTSTNAMGKITTYTYDSMNRLVSVTDPLGHTSAYSYDKMGNRITQTDANGNTTYYKYNYLGQTTETKDALGNITTYTYGATSCGSCNGSADKLTALTDAKGQTTTFAYDQGGRLISETDPLGKVTGYEYDDRGNLRRKTDANGLSTYYVYDRLNRLLQKDNPIDESTWDRETYTYDNGFGSMETGSLLQIKSDALTYDYTYDQAGHIATVTDSRGYTIAYEYDLLSNRTTMTFQPGTAEERITTYTYDTANRLETITSPAGTFTYGYDQLSRRTSLTYPNQIIATYAYDEASRLTTLDHKTGAATIASFTYTHDNTGNRLSKTGTTNETYGYDLIYRLTSVTAPTPETFTYDKIGNRLTGPGAKDTDYQHNAANQMTRGRTLEYIYDNNGNQTARIVPRARDKTWTQTWDYANRLSKVERIKGAERQTVTFKYDTYGRRLEKKIEKTLDGWESKTETYSYVYDNDNILLEIYTDATGKAEKTYYTHGAGVDEHLALERNGQNYFFHQDGLGSVTGITDQNRNVVQAYTYDAFGMVTPSKSFRNSYTNTGREWDKETGLYYHRGRYRDLIDGNFITKDPSGFTDSANLYVYVLNNPINAIDPTGLELISAQEGGNIVNIARLWIGIAYRYGGSNEFGIDCSHLVWRVYDEAGFPYPYKDTGSFPPGGKFQKVKSPQEGDVVLYNGHMGIYTNGKLISARSGLGRVDYSPLSWYGLIRGYYRYDKCGN